MEKQSRLPFFHAYTPKENNILPTDHRALPAAPASLLFWPELLSLLAFSLRENSPLKKNFKISLTDFKRTYMLKLIVSLDPRL